MRTAKTTTSIYYRLARLLIIAGCIAAAVFWVLNAAVEWGMDQYFSQDDYVEKMNTAHVSSLQNYVVKNQLSTRDRERLTEWVKKQKVVKLEVYRNGILVYDSAYSDENVWEAAVGVVYNSWESVYLVEFSDGEAEVFLYGFYTYQFYHYALIAELVLAFLLFLAIVMLGIRKTMKYIRQLSGEIGILEGGNLEYEITVQGRDELAKLASGLDDMRRSFREQVKQEAALTQANRRMITEMSHDLRTPLTALMIYTKILLDHKYENEGQLEEYIRKIDTKAHQIKQLSDHIFEYALVTGEQEVELAGPELFQTVFYDLLSEMAAYLEQQGYETVIDFAWKAEKVRVNADYIIRIFDNLTSNILKYADVRRPVSLRSVYREGYGGFCVENEKCEAEKREESTRIGLQNIRKMMEKMHGYCEVEETEESFRIILQFKFS